MEIAPDGKRPMYQAYLLRCWDEDGAQRFVLEDVFGERQRRGFDSVEALAGYLDAALRREGKPEDHRLRAADPRHRSEER